MSEERGAPLIAVRGISHGAAIVEHAWSVRLSWGVDDAIGFGGEGIERPLELGSAWLAGVYGQPLRQLAVPAPGMATGGRAMGSLSRVAEARRSRVSVS